MRSALVFHGLNRCLASEHSLWELTVVQSHVAQWRLLQVFNRIKPVRLDLIANLPVEALYHPVGFGHPVFCQSVLDTKVRAQPVGLVLPGGLNLVLNNQAVGELAAVVGQQIDDFQGAGVLHNVQEAACARCRLVPFDRHMHLACSPADRYERMAPPGLVGYPRRVFDVDVQVVFQPGAGDRLADKLTHQCW